MDNNIDNMDNKDYLSNNTTNDNDGIFMDSKIVSNDINTTDVKSVPIVDKKVDITSVSNVNTTICDLCF